jgi:16S rRNA (cytidine1402-2'-O)-methyltransferase
MKRSMSGTLYVVATPIGNLEDITVRALRILREVSVIAAEDTRRTAKLLAHYGIGTPTLSFHEHNTKSRLPGLTARLSRGEDVALVSDAGTPGISDPGLELIQACIAADIAVDPIPGPSATLSALVGSGFPLDRVTIAGFPPAKATARKTWLGKLAIVPGTFIFFETPHRIAAALLQLLDFIGERPICVARELTKIHQEFLRGTIREVLTHLEAPRGEFTVVVGPEPEAEVTIDDPAIVAQFRQLTECGTMRRRAAVVELAKRSGRPAREIYSLLEAAKVSGE